MVPEFNIKHYLILISVIFCMIPPFFGTFIKLIVISQFNVFILSLIIIGLIILYLMGKAFEKYGYTPETLKLMSQHDLISALLNKNNKMVLFFFFPLTMVMEEFLFRFYSIGILYIVINLGTLESILVSSLIFSIYHLHFWFKFKNRRLTIIFIIFSFFLGLLNGFVLLTIGLPFCVLIHYLLAFILYLNISKKVKLLK
jgi:hypothetical protein